MEGNIAQDYVGQEVADILKRKKASIKQARLPQGSPAWDAFMEMTWEQVEAGARANRPGVKVVRKLLTDEVRSMSEHPFHKLTTFLKQLEAAHIHYTLACHREDAIMVLVTVPGERLEVEFLGDGSIEVERFLSNGEIGGEEALHALWTRYADPEHAETR